MVSDMIRNEVWHDYWDATRQTRYFEALSKKYSVRFRIFIFAIGAGSLLSTVLPLFGIDNAYLVLSGTFTLICAIVTYVIDDTKKVAVLHAVYLNCSSVRNEYRELWIEIETGKKKNDAEVLPILKKFSDDLSKASSVVGYIGISTDDGINERAAEDAKKVMIDQYNISASPEVSESVA